MKDKWKKYGKKGLVIYICWCSLKGLSYLYIANVLIN